MKLKIRVKQKDFIMFIVVCILLFLVLAIVSMNFISLSNDDGFVGFNLFKYYSMKAFGLTLLIFIISLVAIFMSVSNTIFDFEKGGFGLTFGEKEEKGYSRWLTVKEMKESSFIKKVPVNSKTSDAGGVVMINDGKNMWVDDGEFHTLIIGQSGSGKTSALVDPQVYSLIKHGESMVITDPKGEIYKHNANRLIANGYKIVVINFRDPKEGNAWNPLSIPYRMYKLGKTDKAIELLEDISQNILIDPKNTNDPFWESSASAYFSALALGLFEDAKENEVNISSISNMATVGEEKNGLSKFGKDYFTLKGETSVPYGYAKATITAPDDTKASILSVFQDKIRKFSTRAELSEMLSYSDFNMEDIGKEKTAVFLIVHDEKTTYHSLATIFIKQLYEVLIDVAHKNKDGKLKYRTNFILDEFANMPALKDVTSMVTAARSRLIRFTFIIQNFSQLDEVYGEKNAETIRSNCGNMIYLLTNELSALEKISKLCGEVKSKEKDKTVSTPLVTVTDLQKMKKNEIIVIRMRKRPFRTVLKAAYEVDWGESYEDATLPERESYPVKIFDLKTYVKEEKRKQTMDAISKAQGETKVSNYNGGPTSMPNFDSFMKNEGLNRANNSMRENELFNFNPSKDFMNNQTSKPIFKSDMGYPNSGIFNSNNEFETPYRKMGIGGNPYAKQSFANNPYENSFNNINTNINPFEAPINNTNPVDIDELIKNIDAQIAALEKEEAEEKARNEKTKINENDLTSKAVNFNQIPTNITGNLKYDERKDNISNAFSFDENKNNVNNFYNQPTNIIRESTNKEEPLKKNDYLFNQNEVYNNINNQTITDDQFFDDFFGD